MFQNIQVLLSQLIRGVLLVFLAIGVTLTSGIFSPNANAAAPQQAHENDYYSDIYSGRLRSMEEFNSPRLAAIEDCLPQQLSLENKDTGDRIARALGEWNNDQVERAFNLKDNPELSEAEVQFQRCLNSKGIRFEFPVQ